MPNSLTPDATHQDGMTTDIIRTGDTGEPTVNKGHIAAKKKLAARDIDLVAFTPEPEDTLSPDDGIAVTADGKCSVHNGPWGEDTLCANCSNAAGKPRWVLKDVSGAPVTDEEMAFAVCDIYDEYMPRHGEFQGAVGAWGGRGDEADPAFQIVATQAKIAAATYVDTSYAYDETDETFNYTHAQFIDGDVEGFIDPDAGPDEDWYGGAYPRIETQFMVYINYSKLLAEGNSSLPDLFENAARQVQNNRDRAAKGA